MNYANNPSDMFTPEIQCLESAIVYQNPWMRVREDKIRRPSGATGIYGVVEKDDFAVVVALQDCQLHLVEQYRYPVSGRFWEFPQGSTHGGSSDLMDTARSELREETGLQADRIVRVGRLFEAAGYSNQAFEVFFATGLRQREAQLEAEEEGLISRTFSVAEVQAMIVDGVIRDSVTVAAFGLLLMKGLL